MKTYPFLLTLAVPAFLHAAPPANDQFANATPLTGSSVSFSGTTVEATSEVGEPSNGGSNSVWFKWTAPAYGVAKFAALFSSSSNKHHVEVYVGSSITSLTNVRDSSESSEPQFLINAGKGVTYHIRVVDGIGSNTNPSSFTALIDLDTSGFNQALFQGTTFTNDNFSQAKRLTGTKIKTLAYCRSATREAGEPAETGQNSLWWKWKAPSDGMTILSTAGSDVGTKNRLTVGTGSTVSNLRYGSLSWDSAVSHVLDARKGQTYYFALGEAYYFGLENSSYILSLDHTKDAGNSAGKGKRAKFTTLPIDIVNHSQVKGVFTTKGINDFLIKGDSTRFSVDRKQLASKKWSFVIHKKSSSNSPLKGKFTVIGYKKGKAVAKVTKTFRVW